MIKLEKSKKIEKLSADQQDWKNWWSETHMAHYALALTAASQNGETEEVIKELKRCLENWKSKVDPSKRDELVEKWRQCEEDDQRDNHDRLREKYWLAVAWTFIQKCRMENKTSAPKNLDKILQIENNYQLVKDIWDHANSIRDQVEGKMQFNTLKSLDRSERHIHRYAALFISQSPLLNDVIDEGKKTMRGGLVREKYLRDLGNMRSSDFEIAAAAAKDVEEKLVFLKQEDKEKRAEIGRIKDHLSQKYQEDLAQLEEDFSAKRKQLVDKESKIQKQGSLLSKEDRVKLREMNNLHLEYHHTHIKEQKNIKKQFDENCQQLKKGYLPLDKQNRLLDELSNLREEFAHFCELSNKPLSEDDQKYLKAVDLLEVPLLREKSRHLNRSNFGDKYKSFRKNVGLIIKCIEVSNKTASLSYLKNSAAHLLKDVQNYLDSKDGLSKSGLGDIREYLDGLEKRACFGDAYDACSDIDDDLDDLTIPDY